MRASVLTLPLRFSSVGVAATGAVLANAAGKPSAGNEAGVPVKLGVPGVRLAATDHTRF